MATRTGLRPGSPPKDNESRILQEDISKALREILKFTPFKEGSIIENIQFTAPSDLDKTVAHKLNGAVKGFIIINQYGAGSVWQLPTTNEKQATTHIRLGASATIKVSIWIWR